MVTEQYFCPNAGCASDGWMVQLSPVIPELWRLVDCNDGAAFVVAAAEPVCPRCAATLQARLDLEAAFENTILQPGRLLWL
jgi:hypothetical protein